jgi:hypothetical protein
MYLIAQQLHRAGFDFRFAIANYDEPSTTSNVKIQISLSGRYNRALFAGLPPAYITNNASNGPHIFGIAYRREITEDAGLEAVDALRTAIQPLADWVDTLDPEATRAAITLLG